MKNNDNFYDKDKEKNTAEASTDSSVFRIMEVEIMIIKHRKVRTRIMMLVTRIKPNNHHNHNAVKHKLDKVNADATGEDHNDEIDNDTSNNNDD